MAERKMWIDRETLVGIADAIRFKKGTADLIPVPELEIEILSIEGGITIPDGYIKPEGNLNITENKTVDVTKYARVTVAVEGETAEEWDGTGIVIVPTEDELAGTWVFKDIVNLSPLASSTDFHVNFTYGADNTESTAIRILGGDYVEIDYQHYDDDEGEDVFSTAYYGLNGWYSDQTIHITSKLSDLTDADGESLLAWLKANATKQ